MKIFIRGGLLTVLLLGSSVMANAGNGIKRSEWSFRPEITTDNITLGLAGMMGIRAFEMLCYDEDSSPWWIPYVGYRGNSGLNLIENYSYRIKDTSYNNTLHYEDKNRIFDFKNIGYSFGCKVNYMSKEIPLGFWAKLSYEQEVYKVKGESGVKGYMSEGEWIYDNNSDEKYISTIGRIIGDQLTLSKQMVVPEAGLKIYLGNYRTAEQILMIDLGARYDYAINSKGLYRGNKAVNNGISGIIGFAYGRPDKHFQIGFGCDIPFYNYFNKDFSPDGGNTYPFKYTKKGIRVAMNFYISRGF